MNNDIIRKPNIKLILGLIFTFFIAVAIGTAAMILVFLIPTERIEEHVGESVEIFEKEGVYPTLYRGITSTLDNHTDAWMLLNAMDNREEGLLERAFHVYRVDYEGENPVWVLIRYFSGEQTDSKIEYMRYWHGYLVLLKPALYFITYDSIRKVNIILHSLLFIAIVILMVKRKIWQYIFPFLISFASIMPIANALSMQFATCTYIIMISLIILLINDKAWKESRDKYLYLFLITGMCTSYFDFLTFPAATFGMLYCMYTILNGNISKPVDSIKYFLIYGIDWSIGYVGMWASKWIITSIALKINALQAGINAVKYRSSMNHGGEPGETYTIAGVMSRNFNNWIKSPFSQLLIVFVIIVLFLVIIKGKDAGLKNSIIIFLPTMALTFIWYLFIGNHSWVHSWFTYKEYVIFAFAVSSLPVYSICNSDLIKATIKKQSNIIHKKKKRRKK